MTTKTRGIYSAAILTALFACYFALKHTSILPHGFRVTLKPNQTELEFASPSSRHNTEDKDRPQLRDVDENVVTATQRQSIDDLLGRIRSTLQKIEIANRTTVYDKVLSESHIIVMRVLPPNTNQIDEIYRDLSTELAKLPPDSMAEQQMRQLSSKILAEYLTFQKPVKILHIISRRDGSIFRLTEYYVNDDVMVMPDENGKYVVPLPPVSVMRSDDDFGAPDSWALKRYSHLVTVKEESL